MKVKYPQIQVTLVGQDGNAYAVLGACTKAMKRNNISKEEQTTFLDEATAGDYDHLLQTAVKWFDVS